jgi:hypothetical protein
MEVGILLELLGDRPITKTTPESRQLAELIKKELNIEFDVNLHTGNSVLALFDTFNTSIKLKLLNTNLNDGVDLLEHQNRMLDMQSKLQDKFTNATKSGKRLQTILSFGCATLLALIQITLCWCMYNNIPLPEWEVILILLAVPGMIVLNTNGVFSQENKQLLQATLGHIPPVGPLGMIVGAVTKQRRAQDRMPESYPTYAPNNFNQPHTATEPPMYGASGMRPNIDPPNG